MDLRILRSIRSRVGVSFLAGVTTLAGQLVLQQAPAAAATNYTVPSTIPDDCSAETGLLINDWIASVPDGTASDVHVLTFGLNKCYTTNTTIKLNGRNFLTINGNGSEFKATQRGPLNAQGASGRLHWNILNSADITVQNVTIRSTNTVSDIAGKPLFGTSDVAYHGEHGVRVASSNNVTLLNNSIYSVWGDGILVGNGELQNYNVLVDGVTINQTGRQGVAATKVIGLVVRNANLSWIRWNAFDLEPDADTDWVVRNVEISDTYIKCPNFYAFVSSAGTVSRVRIHDTTTSPLEGTTSCMGYGLLYIAGSSLHPKTHHEFYNNTTTATVCNPNNSPVDIWGAAKVVIRDNDIGSCSTNGLAPVYVNNSSQVQIKRNDLRPAQTVLASVGQNDIDACGNLLKINGVAVPDMPTTCRVKLRAASVSSTSGESSSLTVPAPASITEQDLMVAVVRANRNTTLISAPAGWTPLQSNQVTGDISSVQSVFTKRVEKEGAEPTAYDFGLMPAASGDAQILRYKNVDPAVGLVADGLVSVGATVNAVAPSLSPAVANPTLLCFWSADLTSVSSTPPTAMTERTDNLGNAVVASADQILSGTAASGTRTATLTLPSSSALSQSVLMTPKPSPGP